MSLRGRLLAASLALVAVGLAIAGVATYFALRSFLVQQLDTQLTGATNGVDRALQNGRFESNLLNQLPATVQGLYVDITDVQGASLRTLNVSPPILPSPLPVPTTVGAAGHPFVARNGSHQAYRVQISNLSPFVVTVALPLRQVRQTLDRLIVVELLVGVAVLAAAAGLGSYLVRLGLKPLDEIEASAANIAAGDLTVRVPQGDKATEVGRLGHTLNSMLGRIEVAFEERRRSEAALRASEERLRRFVSDASHELRTPVAAVRAYAELFRRGGDRHPEDLPRLMSRIEAEAARMGVLVEDLLLLTRLDQGRPLEHAPVDLGALASDAVEAAGTIDPGRQVTLQIEGSVEVVGDRDRLRQVVDNLLANVRTHTPAGAPATVAVRLQGGRAFLEVSDSGPGIDPADGQRLFERFYRADPARSRDRGGSGLGLSIVAAIVAAHGGQVLATNRPEGGATFRVDLPALLEPAGPEPVMDDAPPDAPPPGPHLGPPPGPPAGPPEPSSDPGPGPQVGLPARARALGGPEA